ATAGFSSSERPEMKAVLVGSNSSRRYLVGNIILGRQAFDPGDIKSCCVQSEGEVCGRRVTLVKAPGWLRGYDICNTPELFKTEAILSVSPGLHCFILVVNEQRRITETYLKLLGERVWRHVIVLFTFGNALGDKSIEQHIESEGQPLCKIIEKCGNRYHVLDNTSAADDQVTELCSVGLRPGGPIWPMKNIPFLCLQKVLNCCRRMFKFIIHLHCEAPSCQFCSIWLNVSREYSPIPLRIYPATSVSSEPVPLAAIHARAITLPPLCLTRDVVCFGS
uniref:AIG1-type G domain-containing protein n=1 Tax=Mola mola TaxID=94237 RepID=A0A3Q3WRJ5_MOLML